MTRIELSNNQIGDDGATALSEALKVNSTVTEIRLDINVINDAGATALSEALKVNSTKAAIWLQNNQIDVIITTGGTGLTGRDITPEALDVIADKHIPGFGEIFRYLSLKTVGTSSIQSRACAVLARGKYIFALPGSSGGVTDAWEGILKHQLDINHKPCNFVELFPRLKEK